MYTLLLCSKLQTIGKNAIMVIKRVGNKAARFGRSGVTKPASDWTHGLASYGHLSCGPELPQKWG